MDDDEIKGIVDDLRKGEASVMGDAADALEGLLAERNALLKLAETVRTFVRDSDFIDLSYAVDVAEASGALPVLEMRGHHAGR